MEEDCGTANSGASVTFFFSLCLQHLQGDVGTRCYDHLVSNCVNHIARRNYFLTKNCEIGVGSTGSGCNLATDPQGSESGYGMQQRYILNIKP